MRVPDTLIRQCRAALIEAKLTGRDVSDADAVRMLAELGANDVSGKFTVMNEATRDQFVREVETQIAHRMAQRGALLAFELLRPLGVVARVESSGDISVTFTKPIQPGAELTGQLPDEPLHKPETAVRH